MSVRRFPNARDACRSHKRNAPSTVMKRGLTTKEGMVAPHDLTKIEEVVEQSILGEVEKLHPVFVMDPADYPI